MTTTARNVRDGGAVPPEGTPTLPARMSVLLRRWSIPPQLAFLLVGILATVWFLVRVIPKPQRATYPCMRATAPFMSAFFLYLVGLLASVAVFRRARKTVLQFKWGQAALLLIAGCLVALFTLPQEELPVFANTVSMLGPNQPVGIFLHEFGGKPWNSSYV